MTDISGMIRWNANFVRGLAESVLSRAKTIRTSLTKEAGAEGPKRPAAKKSKRTLKKAAVKRATTPGRRTKRADA
jgi:hypothetical protein